MNKKRYNHRCNNGNHNYFNDLNILIKDRKSEWNYYKIGSIQSINDIFENPIQHIKDTFMYAEKRSLLSWSKIRNIKLDLDGFISEARAAHSISTFFLGIKIAQCFFSQKNFGFISCNQEEFYEFSYIWTLTCLYHDFGYVFENNKKICEHYSHNLTVKKTFMSCSKKAKILQEFCKDYLVNYTIWDCKYDKNKILHNGKKGIVFEKYYNSPQYLMSTEFNSTIKFPTRSFELIENYITYILDFFGKLDHGIIGGILFYDYILESYYENYLRSLKDNKNTDIDDFIIRGSKNNYLRFSYNQFPLFTYIADSIINHNIWKAENDSTTIARYKKYALTDLIGNNYEKVNFVNNPLLFILDLADSIEPYKLFSPSNIDHQAYNFDDLINIFKEITINKNRNKLIISVPSNWSEKLENHLNNMTAWMDIGYERIEDTFTIWAAMT